MATKRKSTSKKSSKKASKKSSRKSSKKDLESKIAQLEAKLLKLSTKPETTPPPPPKPAETTPPPPPKPAETTPPPPPKPAEKPAPPAQIGQALAEAWSANPPGDVRPMKARVTGFIPNPDNYWARKHGIRGTAPTTDWNLQKAVVTGYTACSNQYFATRERLCYHPPDKSFGGYGLVMTGAGQVQVQQQAPPPPPPPPQSDTLPKERSYAGTVQKSRKELREEYEQEYLARMEKEEREAEELQRAAAELIAKKESQTQTKPTATQSAMPKGWKPS